MRQRVGPVDSAGHDRDRGPVDRQGAAMRGCVDPERGAGHHGPAPFRQPRTQTAGDGVSVAGAAARAHDRHRPLGEHREVGVAEHPEAQRRHRVVLQPDRPPRVARADDGRADRPGGCELRARVRVDPEPVGTHPEHLGHPVVGRQHQPESVDRSMLGDPGQRALVAGFGDPRPDGPGPALSPRNADGLRERLGGHAATCSSGRRRASARPTSSASGRSAPRRSQSVQANRRHRS